MEYLFSATANYLNSITETLEMCKENNLAHLELEGLTDSTIDYIRSKGYKIISQKPTGILPSRYTVTVTW